MTFRLNLKYPTFNPQLLKERLKNKEDEIIHILQKQKEEYDILIREKDEEISKLLDQLVLENTDLKRQINNYIFFRLINIIASQFSSARFKNLNRNIFNRELINVCQINPFFNLTRNQHVILHVHTKEIMKRTKVS